MVCVALGRGHLFLEVNPLDKPFCERKLPHWEISAGLCSKRAGAPPKITVPSSAPHPITPGWVK